MRHAVNNRSHMTIAALHDVATGLRHAVRRGVTLKSKLTQHGVRNSWSDSLVWINQCLPSTRAHLSGSALHCPPSPIVRHSGDDGYRAYHAIIPHFALACLPLFARRQLGRTIQSE
jgi:hypothetical protein